MSGRFLFGAALMGLGLLLGACAKYESWSVVDNNCSGQGGYYDRDYCADYVAEVPRR